MDDQTQCVRMVVRIYLCVVYMCVRWHYPRLFTFGLITANNASVYYITLASGAYVTDNQAFTARSSVQIKQSPT